MEEIFLKNIHINHMVLRLDLFRHIILNGINLLWLLIAEFTQHSIIALCGLYSTIKRHDAT
ncbi:hypothetical protein H8A87_11925 [Xenorhabdus sp. VLS]|uniref:Uncharacterized protein n=1 Tax=Xenorhabdus lircayensis TaxID=2763499 RepID=A0ABS0U6A1_9GAMM|nr:hypothetical protein [Xenorhabdus lircayensis]